MDYPALLEAHADVLLTAALRDLDAPVPSCPGWDCRRLVSHVGRLFTVTARHLPRGTTEEPERVPAPPRDDTELADYYRRSVADVLTVLRDVDPRSPAWTFTLHVTPGVAGFWSRRLANETLVHAWDAAGAVGQPPAFPPDLAADAIDELLTLLLPAARAVGLSPPGQGSVHVHLTDVPGEWLVRLDGPTATVTTEHAKGDAALRGPAGPVLLALWGRLDPAAPGAARAAGPGGGGPEVHGDVGLLQALRTGR
ncbi:maleylpyruvate isomerase family mycothiol-dependent enzyme [Parafrankia sp. FMc2]|uniref:maleylpyruvate isomerase family mycothiol-dependent enzyme n=1 Tax=Parafrankia sp. FMc2 TaxID=3233196 RepID=UPI0034D6BDBC